MKLFNFNSFFEVSDLVRPAPDEPGRNFAADFRRLAAIYRRLDWLSAVTPTNYAEAKRTWLELACTGETFPEQIGGEAVAFPEPEFAFDEGYLQAVRALHPEFTELRAKLALLTPEHFRLAADGRPEVAGVLLTLLRRRLDSLERTFASIEAQLVLVENGHSRPQFSAQIARGAGNPETVRGIASECLRSACLAQIWHPDELAGEAELDAVERLALSTQTLGADEIRDAFEFALDAYGLRDDWSAEIAAEVSAITVKSTERRVLIPPTRELSALGVARLIAHEIEGHVRGHSNAERLLTDLIADTFRDDEAWLGLAPMLTSSPDESFNEGVAKLNEVALAGDGALPGPFYLTAIAMAQAGLSFGQVTAEIFALRRTLGVSRQTATLTAWNSAYRVFRGGGSYLPAGYWQGFRAAETLRRANREQYELYAQYCSLSPVDLDLLIGAIGRESPRLIPDPPLGIAASWARAFLGG